MHQSDMWKDWGHPHLQPHIWNHWFIWDPQKNQRYMIHFRDPKVQDEIPPWNKETLLFIYTRLQHVLPGIHGELQQLGWCGGTLCRHPRSGWLQYHWFLDGHECDTYCSQHTTNNWVQRYFKGIIPRVWTNRCRQWSQQSQKTKWTRSMARRRIKTEGHRWWQGHGQKRSIRILQTPILLFPPT